MTLAEVTAAGVPITIGGREYQLSILRAKDWGEAARYLHERRPRPLEIVRAALPGLTAEQQRVLLELAYRDERSGDLSPIEDVQRWFATPEGRAYRWWLSIRQRHPEITLERADELLLESLAEEQRAIVERREEEAEGLPAQNPLRGAPNEEAASPGD